MRRIKPLIPNILVTDRLLLIRPRHSDAGMINEAIRLSFRALNKWMPWAKTLPSLSDTKAFLKTTVTKKRYPKQFNYLVLELETKSFVGIVGVPRLSWDHRTFEIGYWLSSKQTGKGYCTEAVRVITKLLFKTFGAVRVEIRNDIRNKASRKVAERCGFKLEGVLRNDSRDNLGKVCSTSVYSLVSKRQLR